MATKKLEIGILILAILIMAIKGATAQSSCSSTILMLSPCMNYVTGNTSSTPSSSCCSSLAGVVQSQPQCLCSLMLSGGSFGVYINQTLAMALPALCNLSTPPISRCNGVANGPASAPAPSPLSSTGDGSTEPTDSPIVPSIPASGNGSKTSPTNDGSNVVSSIRLITASALFFAAWTININCVKF